MAPCYSTIQEAVDESVSGDVINIAQGTYNECIILDTPLSLVFQGGWDETFSTQGSGITLIKQPVILNGQLSLRMISITGPVSLYVNSDGICGGRAPCYSDIQDAVDGACSGDTVRICQGTYPESIILSLPFGLTLDGGWDATYTAQTSNTTFIKPPKARKGTIKMKMLSMRP